MLMIRKALYHSNGVTSFMEIEFYDQQRKNSHKIKNILGKTPLGNLIILLNIIKHLNYP